MVAIRSQMTAANVSDTNPQANWPAAIRQTVLDASVVFSLL